MPLSFLSSRAKRIFYSMEVNGCVCMCVGVVIVVSVVEEWKINHGVGRFRLDSMNIQTVRPGLICI